MKIKLHAMAILAFTCFYGCSKDSTTILQTETTVAEKIRRSMRNTEAQSGPPLARESEHLLLQKGKLPSLDSVDYYSVKVKEQDNKTKKIIVTALVLNLSEHSPQDFYRRVSNVSNVSSVEIIADKILINTPIRFPGANVFIKAQELVFTGNGKISTTPDEFLLLPANGIDGIKGNNGGSIYLNVAKIDLGAKQLRFELSGGKGQGAGHGKPGALGLSVTPLDGDVIKECITTVVTCTEREAGELPQGTSTECKGTDQVPGNGANAVASGVPGMGGNAGNLYLLGPSNFDTASVRATFGASGEMAPLAKGGKAGTPLRAVHRKVTVNKSAGFCNRNGGEGRIRSRLVEEVVVAQTNDGVDFAPRSIENTAKSGAILSWNAIEVEAAQTLQKMGENQFLRLEYAKDLYRNNYFSQAHEVLMAITQANNFGKFEGLGNKLVTDEAATLLNLLNSNKDMNGIDLNLAPTLSLESTMEIYRRNVQGSLDTIAFSATMKKHVLAAEGKIKDIDGNKEKIRQQIKQNIENHEIAYSLVPALENKLVDLQHARLALEESLQKFEAQIHAEAASNIHSQEKKKKLLGGLKLIATLASVSPLGAPAAQAIGTGINALLDLSQRDASWQDALGEGLDVYHKLEKVDWKKSHESWNSIYGSLERKVFENNSKLEKGKLKTYLSHLYSTTKPLSDEIMKHYKATYAKKVSHTAYEAEVQRIKSVHPEFKDLMGKLNQLQQKKAEVEGMLSEMTAKMSSSEADLIRDFAMIAAIENDESEFMSGLNFSVTDVLGIMEKRARQCLAGYKSALVRAYNYRTLMDFPGSNDLEGLIKQLNLFATKTGNSLSGEDLKDVYAEDMAEIGEALYQFIQNGNFKEYESEHVLDLSPAEIAALVDGKKIYLDLTLEKSLFENKDNVRIISIEVADFKVEAFYQPTMEFSAVHSRTSILSKNGKDYAFKHSADAPAATWLTRLDLRTNLASPVKESAANLGLLESIIEREASPNALMFNRVGAKSVFELKLHNAKGAIVHQLGLKIKYSYSLK